MRVIEKTRVPLLASKRLDVSKGNAIIDDGSILADTDDLDLDYEVRGRSKGKKRVRAKEMFDEEVYDDSSFYSMLLKTFITSSSSDITGMRKADILAMQKFKQQNNRVDRKASKGRKVRYILHPKLQNFMFPVQTVQTDNTVDGRLFNSLFR